MGALLPNQGGSTPTCCLPVPWSPTLGVNPGPLPLAPAALAQDPAAEAPSDSSVTSVLLSVTQSHPEAQQLLVMVYSLLTIICSQGGSARPSLGQGRVPGARAVLGPLLRWLDRTACGWSVPHAQPCSLHTCALTACQVPPRASHEVCFTLKPSLPLLPCSPPFREHLGV